MFTAAIMFCLVDVPRAYDTCHVVHGQYKTRLETTCWDMIYEHIEFQRNLDVDETYEVVNAQCFNWFESKGEDV